MFFRFSRLPVVLTITVWMAAPLALFAQTTGASSPGSGGSPQGSIANVVIQAFHDMLNIQQDFTNVFMTLYCIYLGMSAALGSVEAQRWPYFFVGAIIVFTAESLAGIYTSMFLN